MPDFKKRILVAAMLLPFAAHAAGPIPGGEEARVVSVEPVIKSETRACTPDEEAKLPKKAETAVADKPAGVSNTTALAIGGAAGGLLGAIVGGKKNRLLGGAIGAAGGALAGKLINDHFIGKRVQVNPETSQCEVYVARAESYDTKVLTLDDKTLTASAAKELHPGDAVRVKRLGEDTAEIISVKPAAKTAAPAKS